MALLLHSLEGKAEHHRIYTHPYSVYQILGVVNSCMKNVSVWERPDIGRVSSPGNIVCPEVADNSKYESKKRKSSSFESESVRLIQLLILKHILSGHSDRNFSSHNRYLIIAKIKSKKIKLSTYSFSRKAKELFTSSCNI